ncbi:hypothetical protein AVEN_98398-1 [Araneus ventricosus]|uniref:Uncharacterized protein n=1 Tax=Araneus ventricosus TaxID=182803 RepID=A0A4Y2A004_ARAVE|nr:hypothetical protein AVEN_98398-1 [Araneus ventricosus]
MQGIVLLANLFHSQSYFFHPISVQTELRPWQAVWHISIDFYSFFLLAFQNIQFVCEVNGWLYNGPYAPFGFDSMRKQPWRNKQNDRPISDSEIKAVLSQLFKTDQWLPPAGHVSEDVTSHA